MYRPDASIPRQRSPRWSSGDGMATASAWFGSLPRPSPILPFASICRRMNSTAAGSVSVRLTRSSAVPWSIVPK